MTLDLVFFLILSLISIATALGMLLSRNAVYSALFLVLNFVTVAVFYLLLGAPFIAMAQVTVYAGAIMVLFLFVIMLLGAENLPRAEVLPWQKPLAGVLAAALAVEATFIFLFPDQDDHTDHRNHQQDGGDFKGQKIIPKKRCT
ncbi:MAG TPA: NADH-quinone oxidoreductase subunit J [Anaerolineales bacterium]|nr:NADH-quinone oxidoreductase subunit J [Anaerolineales bacterium]